MSPVTCSSLGSFFTDIELIPILIDIELLQSMTVRGPTEITRKILFCRCNPPAFVGSQPPTICALMEMIGTISEP